MSALPRLLFRPRWNLFDVLVFWCALILSTHGYWPLAVVWIVVGGLLSAKAEAIVERLSQASNRPVAKP